ncbi:MAG: tyrosine-protein phosphatase [Clostridiales bacterium]|nr:tyrosine-protein phosphatase [Clostridiales bacterium]
MYNPDDQLIRSLKLVNCRELGGMPLSNGKTFKKGVFIRSSSPEKLTPEQVQEVKDYGVKCVVDLRAEAELRDYKNPFQNDPDVDFCFVSLFPGDPNNLSDDLLDFIRKRHLGDYYVRICEDLGSDVVKAMRYLLNSKGLTLFHCTHGKDRTGTITALLYLLAGASRENIILNYEASYKYLEKYLERRMTKMPDDMKHLLRSDKLNMEIFLDYVDERWNGDITGFFRFNGMTDEEISALKAKCVD